MLCLQIPNFLPKYGKCNFHHRITSSPRVVNVSKMKKEQSLSSFFCCELRKAWRVLRSMSWIYFAQWEGLCQVQTIVSFYAFLPNFRQVKQIKKGTEGSREKNGNLMDRITRKKIKIVSEFELERRIFPFTWEALKIGRKNIDLSTRTIHHAFDTPFIPKIGARSDFWFWN